jgi:hypothetical protein
LRTIVRIIRFLECEQSARAAYLVTGNIKDFPDSWLDTKIVTARSFLEIMSGETEKPPTWPLCQEHGTSVG